MVKRSIFFHAAPLKITVLFMLVTLLLPSTQGGVQHSMHSTQSSVHMSSQMSIPDDGDPVASITVGPYLQDVSATGITVAWQTNMGTSFNAVYWGIPPNCDNVTVEMIQLCGYVPNLHMVRLEGLLASTTYCYRVVSDGAVSSMYTFSTALNQDATLRFVVYGDTRQSLDGFEGYPYEDWLVNATKIAHSIAARTPHLVLHTGDITLFGNDPAHWHEFFDISEFLPNSPLYPVLGNHEFFPNPLYPLNYLYFDYFSLPGNERWYSFDSGPVHFIALDTNIECQPILLSQELLWLQNDLASTQKTWIVVFEHHPLYSSGEHGSSLYWRALLHPLFSLYHVDVVFCAHDHGYERSMDDGVTYIVTGGGGALLRDVGSSWFTLYSAKVHHYCYLKANQSKLVIQAICPITNADVMFDSVVLDPRSHRGDSFTDIITEQVALDKSAMMLQID